MKSTMYTIVALLFSNAVALNVSSADDWPHWMGPNRDNTWNETGIIDKFPEGGPKVLWRTPIKSGYSGPAVADGKVVITDFVTDGNWKLANFERQKMQGTERVLCLNESDGSVIWKHETDVTYAISYPAGPRCTPIIENGKVYTLGAEGDLYCFNLSDGSVIWEKHLEKDYKTNSPTWGYAAHPLIDGDKLITLAGGEGTHCVALNKNTGEEIWRTITAPEQGYSPPSIIEQAGVRQLILLRPNGVSGVNPETGEVYWTVSYAADSGSIIMTPIQIDNNLFVGGYSRKSMMVEMGTGSPTAKMVWQNKARDVPSPVNVQPFLDKKTNIVYGCDQNGDLRASQLPEGKLLWATSEPISERRVGNGTAFIVRQGDRYWLFNDSGELVICNLTKDGYKEIDRAKVVEPTNVAFNRPVVWSMPAYANKRAYIRNDKEIVCIDLAK